MSRWAFREGRENLLCLLALGLEFTLHALVALAELLHHALQSGEHRKRVEARAE